MSDRAIFLPRILVAILCATVALAQTPSTPPKPGPEAKKLEAFVGQWKLEGEVKPPMGTGKATGTASCEWVADKFGVFCRESTTMAGGPPLIDVELFAYDPTEKNYYFSQVTAGGGVWTGRGTVDGDTWSWKIESTMEGKPIHVRFINKFTSPDSYDFKNEIGSSPDSMQVMMDGKETRIKPASGR